MSGAGNACRNGMGTHPGFTPAFTTLAAGDKYSTWAVNPVYEARFNNPEQLNTDEWIQ